MARIAGVNVPREKRVEIGLTYIYGIGRSTANKVLAETGIRPDTYVRDLTEDEIGQLRDVIEKRLVVEGDLKRDRLLPRVEAPSWAAAAWSAHQDERADPQGRKEDRRQKEEVEANWHVRPHAGGHGVRHARTSPWVTRTSRRRSTTRSSP
jgi:hypothetical protein